MSEITKEQFIKEISELYRKVLKNPKQEDEIIESHLKDKMGTYTDDDIWNYREALRYSRIILEEG